MVGLLDWITYVVCENKKGNSKYFDLSGRISSSHSLEKKNR